MADKTAVESPPTDKLAVLEANIVSMKATHVICH